MRPLHHLLLPILLLTTPLYSQTTSPATAPAEPNDPKSIEVKFELALFNGDADQALDCCWFSNDDVKTKSKILVYEAAARFRLVSAISQQFSEKVDAVNNEMILSMKQAILLSTLDLQGNKAALLYDGHPTSYAIRTQNIWKIDIEKLNHENGDSKEALTAAAARSKIIDIFITDLHAGKFKTAQEARNEFQHRLSNLTPATTPH